MQYVLSMEKTGAELLGISAGHCTRLEAAGWGHSSAAKRHRKSPGTLYPWPMFSINPDNDLLTVIFFSWKKRLSITGELLAFLSPEGMNCPWPPCKCRPASRVNNWKSKNRREEENITLTRFTQWIVPAKHLLGQISILTMFYETLNCIQPGWIKIKQVAKLKSEQLYWWDHLSMSSLFIYV